MNKVITSKDIAKLAGVSQPTVSRAFNNPDAVDPSKRAVIMEVARKMHYAPNAIARSLVSNKTNIIGAVIEDFENPFYVSFIHCLSKQFSSYGKKILLLNPSANGTAADLLNEARSFRVDGLVIASASLSRQLPENDIPSSIPVVMINRPVPSLKICSLASDDVLCGRMVADYFLKKNFFTQYIYISGLTSKSSSSNRRKGFSECLKESGIDIFLDISGNFTYKGGIAAAAELLRKVNLKNTAVFAANDLMALGFIDMLRMDGRYSIPSDVSIIGVDDIEQSSWENYNLSSMHVPISEMINYAFSYLNSNEKERIDLSGSHLFPCTFIPRSSSL